MGIFDIFKKKVEPQFQGNNEVQAKASVQPGIATSKRIDIDFHNINSIENCFIAFDVETTGLNPVTDRIVEIGAVIFQNGKVNKTFSSLVNPGISIPDA